MNRIDFLKRIFLSGASVLVAKYAGAKLTTQTSEVYLNSPYIAGFQYYNGAEIESFLKVGDNLSLQRDAKNQHDYFAVEVHYKNRKLGFLPRTDNKIIARMMDQGEKLNAKIRSIDPDAHPFSRVQVRVYLEKE
ncbi:HIRAN domain-containing protein [uncultured Draconibacterium sp.]|uniref:HIRAN domain-containing protein n=1 Tax=uncultured Draconibacterium sp. TaxID=1573823 RepID=UPI0029C86157|nr:HIRAN domain-containing protein [uncultured Draconibacterium sp.]